MGATSYELFRTRARPSIRQGKLIMMKNENPWIEVNNRNETTILDNIDNCVNSHTGSLCFLGTTSSRETCESVALLNNFINETLCNEKLQAVTIRDEVVIRLRENEILAITNSSIDFIAVCLPDFKLQVQLLEASVIKAHSPYKLTINTNSYFEAPLKTTTNYVNIETYAE